MINFKNKKILITGATGGSGQALVKKFLSLEGDILATGTKIEKLDALKKEFPNIQVNYVKRDKFMPVRGTLSNLKAKKLLNYSSRWNLEKGYIVF